MMNAVVKCFINFSPANIFCELFILLSLVFFPSLFSLSKRESVIKTTFEILSRFLLWQFERHKNRRDMWRAVKLKSLSRSSERLHFVKHQHWSIAVLCSLLSPRCCWCIRSSFADTLDSWFINVAFLLWLLTSTWQHFIKLTFLVLAMGASCERSFRSLIAVMHQTRMIEFVKLRKLNALLCNYAVDDFKTNLLEQKKWILIFVLYLRRSLLHLPHYLFRRPAMSSLGAIFMSSQP